jgi:hypothetical protein
MNPRRTANASGRAKSATSKTVTAKGMLGGKPLPQTDKTFLIDYAKALSSGPSTSKGTPTAALIKALKSRPPGYLPNPVGGFSIETKDMMRGVRPKTMRLEPRNEAGLDMLKDALGAPVNRMVNVAVSQFIERTTVALELSLTEALERVKAHRRADPTFAKDLQAFVSDEAKHGAKDPLEGENYNVTPPARKKASAKATKDYSALKAVRDILRG